MSARGESYLAGLIGDGVTPSLTPLMHEREADEQGLRCIYRPIDLPIAGRRPDEVGELVRYGASLGFSAFNVTHPCKELVVPALDELGLQAARLGACNTVVVDDGRLVGHNTDVTGFAWGLRRALPDADLAHVVQIGAGGAGIAVSHALLEAGTARLTLADLDAGRALGRVASLLRDFPDRRIDAVATSDLAPAVTAATGVVNATPVGMHHHPGVPLDPDLLTPSHWVADIVYRPLSTRFVEAATARGCAAMDGGWMAVGQAIDAFALMTGRAPDPDRLRAHFLELVAAEG